MDAPTPPPPSPAAEVRPAAPDTTGGSGADASPPGSTAGERDTLTTFPKGPPSHAYGPTDYRPATRREVELCRKADQFDWVYFAGTVVADAGVVYADAHFFRFQEQPGIRLIGPSIAGLAWGWTLSGGVLSLPKCDPLWVAHPPPEGEIRSRWPLAITLAGLSAVTAPFFARIEQGPVRDEWPVWERSMSVILPMATGIVGAFMPYVLPPRTYAAARELEKIRLDFGRDEASDGSRRGRFSIGYRWAF